MNAKRFWLAILGLFAGKMALDVLIHVVILNNRFYKNMPQLFGMEGQNRNYPFLSNFGNVIAAAIFAYFFAAIFARGVETKGWIGQGLRYGAMIWGVAMLPAYVSMYSWSLFPGRLLLWWIILNLLEAVILGWIVAMIYKAGGAETPAGKAAA